VGALDFSWLGARIMPAVHERDRHAQLAQPAIIEILLGVRTLIGELQPYAAIPLHNMLPAIGAVIFAPITAVIIAVIVAVIIG